MLSMSLLGMALRGRLDETPEPRPRKEIRDTVSYNGF